MTALGTGAPAAVSTTVPLIDQVVVGGAGGGVGAAGAAGTVGVGDDPQAATKIVRTNVRMTEGDRGTAEILHWDGYRDQLPGLDLPYPKI